METAEDRAVRRLQEEWKEELRTAEEIPTKVTIPLTTFADFNFLLGWAKGAFDLISLSDSNYEDHSNWFSSQLDNLQRRLDN